MIMLSLLLISIRNMFMDDGQILFVFVVACNVGLTRLLMSGYLIHGLDVFRVLLLSI